MSRPLALLFALELLASAAVVYATLRRLRPRCRCLYRLLHQDGTPGAHVRGCPRREEPHAPVSSSFFPIA